MALNTTKIGTEFENRVFKFFSSLLDEDKIAGASKKHSKIQKHQKYKTNTGRVIDCDITIENYNPLCMEKWSSLIIIECKHYNSKVDIADLDEFQNKMNLISSSGVKGIMVSTVGFSRNFIKQAQNAHVGLMVLSEEKSEWFACRNTVYKSEDLMNILCGNKQVGAFPVMYNNGNFKDVVCTLSDLNVAVSNSQAIDILSLRTTQIEEKANELYKKYTIRTNDIAGEILAKEYPDYGIRFEDLPNGVLGKLSLRDKTITISNEIKNDSHRLHFTLAHEIGHLVLHYDSLYGKMNELEDYSIQQLSMVSETIIRRIEKQANLFASYLLMPKNLVILNLAPMVSKYRLTRGFLWLDNQKCNIRDVNAVLSELSQKMNVSKEAIKIRLKEMNLLREANCQPLRLDQIV